MGLLAEPSSRPALRHKNCSRESCAAKADDPPRPATEHLVEVAEAMLGADEPNNGHEEAQREQEREHDRHHDQGGHLDEEIEKAEIHDTSGACGGDRAGEDRGSHVADCKLRLLGTGIAAMVCSFAENVCQVHHKVDRIANHDDASDGLADAQIPVHGASAEAQYADHDGPNSAHRVGGDDDVFGRREQHDEGDGPSDRAALEEALEQLAGQIELCKSKGIIEHHQALQRCRRGGALLSGPRVEHFADVEAFGETLFFRHRRPDLHRNEVHQPVFNEADVASVIDLPVEEWVCEITSIDSVPEFAQLGRKLCAHREAAVVPSAEVLEQA
mmetsp:Transcript_44368/g.134475  ORF Transcript_44368/g.134475 Transcript_44368/m.134475 type:complete len:329 (+) Transcript_44368:249-1235(+)